MKKRNQFFRSTIAFVLVLAALLPYCTYAKAMKDEPEKGFSEEYISAEEAQEIIDNADYVIDLDGNYEFPELDEEYVEQTATLEEQANLYLYGTTPSEEDKPETKAVKNYTDYVFLSFEIGNKTRNFNWQLVTTSTSKPYFSNDYISRHAGYYSGTNTGLFIPVTNTDAGKKLLGKYKVNSTDIAQVHFHMSENTSEGIVDNGTTQVNSFFTFWSSGSSNNSYVDGCGYQKIYLKTNEQTVTFKLNSGSASTHHGKELYGVRWDPYQTPDSDTDGWATNVRIYTHYIYVGPEKYKPVNVQYTNGSGTVLTLSKVTDDLTSNQSTYTPTANGYIGYGQKPFSWPNDGLAKISGTEQTIWGWEIYEKNSSGVWTNTYEFIVDPTTHTCTVDTQFRKKSVTIPIVELDSDQEYTTGTTQAEKDDDRYVMSVDAFDTMQIDNGHYGTPIDYAILMDRSGSMGDFVSGQKYFDNDETTGLAEIEAYLETLDKTKWEGYYRARGWSKNRSATGEHVYSESTDYIYTMPLRYNRTKTQGSDKNSSGAWEVLVLETNCECDGARHAKYGIYAWKSTGMKYCSHVKWVSVERAYKVYNAYREATNKNHGRNFTARFGIGVSRIGKQQEAVEKLLNKIYASNAYLPKDTYNTVSIVGYGHSVFIKDYPYYNQDGLTEGKTPNMYPAPSKFKLFPTLSKVDDDSATIVCSAKSVALHYANYDQIIDRVRSHFIFGQTRIDGAVRLLSNNQSYMEKHYYADKDDTGAHALTHTDYMPAKNSARKRVVLAICDGEPTWYEGTEFHAKAAKSAVAGAYNLKKNGVTIYSVGISESYSSATSYNSSYHAASTNTSGRITNFMLLLSSKYPNATGFPENATEAADTTMIGSEKSGTYFYKSASNAGTLAEALEAIYSTEMPELKPTGKSGEASLWLYEEFTREWMLDTTPGEEIKIYAKPYNTDGTFGDPVLIGSHPIVTVDASGKKTVHIDCSQSYTLTGNGYKLHIAPTSDQGFTATLQWTDAKKSFLRKTSWDTGYAATAKSTGKKISANYGYKVVMEIPLEVDRDHTLGGNNIPLTKSPSGCYKANSKADTAKGDKLYDYEQPNANVLFAVGSESYDYFMTMEDYIKIHNANKGNAKNAGVATVAEEDPIIEAYNNMIRVNADMSLVNAEGYSKLDYLSFEVKLQDENNTLVVHRKADVGDTTYDVNTDNRAQLGNLLEKDTSFSGYVKLTYSSNKVDSFKRDPYPNVDLKLNPNLYVPKFAVVDFDATATVDLQKEGAIIQTMGTNGSYTTSEAKFNFRTNYSNSKEKQRILTDWETIPYTVQAINPTKDGETLVNRNVYIIPDNVVSYDDTLFTFDTVNAGTAWKTVGTYTGTTQTALSNEVHGYDKNFATTGDFHGASMMTTVTEDLPYAKPASFEFYGTGFELLSRTAPDSGTMIIEIFKANANGTYNAVADTAYLVDTYLSDETLCQVPVVKYLSGEAAANYKVHIIGFYDIAFDHKSAKRAVMTEEEARQRLGYGESVDFHYITFDETSEAKRATITPDYNLYVDGCRIYNSVPDDAAGIRDFVYSLAGEKDANIYNINTRIVDATNLADWTGGKSQMGMLYIEATNENVGSDGEIDTSGNHYYLGMEGTLNTKEQNGKYYVLNSDGTNIKHGVYKTAIYYEKRTSRRIHFYCTDSNGTPVLLTDAEARKYVGDGERIVYYGSKYRAIGPENEVYLSKNQGVAFTVNTANDKIFLGLKTKGSASMEIWNGSAFVPFTAVTNYTSDATMYFDISTYGPDIIIKNTGSGILSLCNIKCASADGEVDPFTVSARLIAKAACAFETEVAETPVDDSLTILHSLNLQSDIAVNLTIPLAYLEGYDRYVMETTVNGKTYLLNPEIKGSYVYFTVEGLTAVNMNDNISSVLHLTKGDEVYISPEDNYSIAYYAYAMMNRENASTLVKTLCANLLRYGSAAQIYKNYHTDCLADEEMTEEQKTYLTDLDTVTFGSANAILSDLENPAISWVGKTLNLESKVSMKYVFSKGSYTGELSDLTLHVSYENTRGEPVSQILSDAEVYNASVGYYAFTLDTLLAAELRSVVSVQIYAGDTPVSCTLQYSADTYGNNKTGALLDLCKALFAYSDSAKAYFAG